MHMSAHTYDLISTKTSCPICIAVSIPRTLLAKCSPSNDGTHLARRVSDILARHHRCEPLVLATVGRRKPPTPDGVTTTKSIDGDALSGRQSTALVGN
mmetsp:Transcript_8855/g.21743  ORF Transcript_8855/g.21743 Transcript_8855/m.21743 type:complete len:98 (-) Transcript_8855:663-956(-)